MLVFAVVCAIAAVFTVSCVPLASTNSVEEKVDNSNLVDNEEIADESENDNNVVTDESTDELIDEEVADSDELVDEEEDSDSDNEQILPEIALAFGEPTSAKRGEPVSIFFTANFKVQSDVCVSYEILGAAFITDYVFNISPETCGPNTIRILANTDATVVTFEVSETLAQDKTMLVIVKPGTGYDISEGSQVAAISLIAEDATTEISDVDSVVETEEESDTDSVEETEETSDEDSVETEGEETDDSEVSDEILTDEEPDETPDVDTDVVPTIQNPITSESCKDKVILTELVPGNYIEGWNAGSSNRGFEYYNATGITVWYRSVGFCAITSSMDMNAKGEGVTASKHVEGVRCVDHNIVSCGGN